MLFRPVGFASLPFGSFALIGISCSRLLYQQLTGSLSVPQVMFRIPAVN